MKTAFRAVTVVWVLLVAATIASWTIGHHPENSGVRIAPLLAVAIVLLAMTKIQMVMEFFMELRFAPTPLRLVALAWSGLTGAIVIGIYCL